MRALHAFLALLAFCLAACSPTWNWREFRPEGTALRLMLPCKPDLAQREVALDAHKVQMRLLSCKAGNATFALAWAELPPAANVPQALAQWTAATLGNIQGSATPASPFLFNGSSILPQSVRAGKSGKQPDGQELSFNGAWFAMDRAIFQASVHGAAQTTEVLDTYFSGIGRP